MSEADGWCDFTAGWVAGIIGVVIGQPMDTIKVRQQTLAEAKTMTIARNTFQYEGVRGFYKGMLFPALSAGVLNSVFFGVYGNSLRWLETWRHDPPDLRRTCAEGNLPPHRFWHLDVYLAGCVAGCAQVLLGCPIDIIKIKLQNQTGTPKSHWAQHYEAGYKGPLDCAQRMYRESGIRGFYKGFNSMLMRDMPTFGIYVLAYEHLLSVGRPESQHDSDYSITRQLVAGGLAGVISWQLVIPLDVVKSRIQSDNAKDPMYRGTIDCFIKSYKADGLGVFMRGFWMVSARAFAVNSGVFVAFEWALNLCGRANIPPAAAIR